MIKTVIFDLDDTLYDEVDFCRSGFRAVAEFISRAPNLAANHSTDVIFATLWEQFQNGERKRTFNASLEALGIAFEADTIDHLLKVYREHRPDILLPAESKGILDLLTPDYSLGLLTDGYMPTQRLKVESLGIGGYFKHIMYTEELGRKAWKPSQKGFKHLLKALEVKSQECVYVADNAEKDFLAPNVLGMETIQLIRPNRLHTAAPAHRQAEPGQLIASITQLPAALNHIRRT